MELYEQVITGKFISRPNRFIAHVETAAGEEICHVKNTGRCAELLTPGAIVTLSAGSNPFRKTRYDMVAVKKGNLYINMDSQAPNRAAEEALPRLLTGLTLLKPEKNYGDSRLDFYFERGEEKGFVEVKGVTLEQDGAALFPDAPTERGVKHIHELEKCVGEGYTAYLLFVIQMKGPHLFGPNRATHPAFADALVHAKKAGVRVMAYDCLVTPTGMTIDSPVRIELE